MEEQQQAEERQQQHRGAGGSGGRGGAGAAAQGPHHGGCLTRNGAPPAGNSGHPRRGVAATTSAVATPASSPASAPSQRIRGGRGRWVEREKGKGAAKDDWRAAPPATGVECGGVRPRRSGRAENPGAEAALPSGMRRGGSRAPLGGGRQGGAEPRLQAAAARSCGSPPHHLPPGGRLSAQPSAATGTVLRNEQNRRGALRRQIPPDTLLPGRLQKREEGTAGSV